MIPCSTIEKGKGLGAPTGLAVTVPDLAVCRAINGATPILDIALDFSILSICLKSLA